VRELIESQAAQDKRIRVTFRAENGHISANSNSALDLATGDYVALLDADDVITEDALFWVAHEIALDPQTDMIFSDEDKIDEEGRRFDPYFKPAWNPALMLGQNMFCHLGVYRRSLVEQVGRFRVGFEGAQDHDLALRCADAIAPERIRHIPRVLYHWRATAQSTAATLESKPYALDAGVKAVEDHLRRRGAKAHVETAGIFYRAVYELPDPPPLVSLIVPTTLRNAITRRCLQSVLGKTRYGNFELLLLATEADLAAGRAAFADCLADARVRALTYRAESFNYSWVNNVGAAEARGSLLCFLNDDVEVIGDDWLDTLVARVSLAGVGVAGPMLYYPSDKIQHAGVLLGVGGVADHAFRTAERGQAGYFARAALEQDYSCVTAACMLVRRDLFETIGGFDAELPTAFNDVDLCIRLRRTGARIVWTPAAELYHHESLTYGAHNSPQRAAQFERDVLAIRARWGAVLDRDPAYNPNLSFDREHQFQLAAPPRTPFAADAIDLQKPVSRTAWPE
jgi:GT2 family glycosyltransferase